MATYEELMLKARELAASGRTDEARRVAEIAVSRRGDGKPEPQEAPPWGYVGEPGNYRPDVKGGGALRSFMRGAQNGLTLGAGDEIVAAGASALGPRSYGTELDAERERARQNREEHPFAYYGGYIPGTIASTLAGWGAAGVSPAGATALGTLGRGAGMGAAEGAGIGFAEGEGGFANRAKNAAMLGTLGGVTGGAMVPMAQGLQRLGRGAADMASGAVEGLTGRGSQSKANRVIAATLARSGRSVDDVTADVARAAAEGQPEFRVMDALGVAGQRRASGVVRAGGDGAEEISQFLRQRGVDAPDRMLGFVDDAFPVQRTSEIAQRWTGKAPASAPRTAEQAKVMLEGARGDAADVLYDAARDVAGPVDARGAVSAIDRRTGGMQGVDINGDGIDAKLLRFRNRLISRNPASIDPAATSVELSDFDRFLYLKQEVQDAKDAALRKGRGNEARELGKLFREIDQALENASTGYRSANDTFRRMSDVVDSVDVGRSMTGGGRHGDTIPRFEAMTPDQAVAARAGYGDNIAREIEKKQSAAPDVARAFTSTKRRLEAEAMAENPDVFLRRLGRESAMNDTMKRSLGGSLTADNLQDVADLGPLASAGRAAADVAQGRTIGAVQNLGSAVAPYLSGVSGGTRKLIAEALMSNNPSLVLGAAETAHAGSQASRARLAAMLRAALRQPAVEAAR